MYSKILILIFRVENHTFNPYVQENLNPYILGRNPTLNPYVEENLNPYILCGKPYPQSLCTGKSQSLFRGLQKTLPSILGEGSNLEKSQSLGGSLL